MTLLFTRMCLNSKHKILIQWILHSRAKTSQLLNTRGYIVVVMSVYSLGK
jgi:predicted metallopeptidase